MLKSIVISILRVNWLFGSNSSYHIKHRTQQYMFNNIDQSKWIKNCSQKHQLVCQSTFYFILALTWCDHVGQSNLQLKLFEKKQRYTHTHAHTHCFFEWQYIIVWICIIQQTTCSPSGRFEVDWFLPVLLGGRFVTRGCRGTGGGASEIWDRGYGF